MSLVNRVSILQAVEAARILVFDFDGTLVDSNEIKWQGFEYVFADYGDRMNEIRNYCRGSNHTIRGEKFRHVCESILDLEYTLERAKFFHERYAEFTTDAVASAPEIPGAEKFLRSIRGRSLSLLSSTPHAILLQILDRKGWAILFDRIQGAPVVKREWLRSLQKNFNCSPDEVLFFGDTEEDEASADDSGCTFIRVGWPRIKSQALFIENFEILV